LVFLDDHKDVAKAHTHAGGRRGLGYLSARATSQDEAAADKCKQLKQSCGHKAERVDRFSFNLGFFHGELDDEPLRIARSPLLNGF
jgi:hypothetical protein